MFINVKKYSLIALLALSSFAQQNEADHAIYISVIEVDHDEQTVRIKTFSDDLINGLKSENSEISLSTDPCSILSTVEVYVADHLQLFVNEERAQLSMKDCSIQSDTHWMIFTYDSVGPLEKLRIETQWLTDLFLDQQNIIKVAVGEDRQHSRLNATETSFEMEL